MVLSLVLAGSGPNSLSSGLIRRPHPAAADPCSPMANLKQPVEPVKVVGFGEMRDIRSVAGAPHLLNPVTQRNIAM
jgi:hypothetical protein